MKFSKHMTEEERSEYFSACIEKAKEMKDSNHLDRVFAIKREAIFASRLIYESQRRETAKMRFKSLR